MSAEPPRSTCDSLRWRQVRERLLKRLARDTAAGVVDRDIVDVLEAINSCPYMVTSSSCSGRIAVFAAPHPKDKKAGGIVASWHGRVEPSELLDAIREALATGQSYVWASAQPPLVALHSCSLYWADVAANLMAHHGFKYVGYRFTQRSVSYYLTVRAHSRIDVPLRVNGLTIIEGTDPGMVQRLAYTLNLYFLEGQRELVKLRAAARRLATLCEQA